MSKKNKGSLGYQMMKALQGIFRPGASRHAAKKHHRERGLITSISTMRNMSANVHQFARFIRSTWPEVKDLPQVRPEMALAYLQALQDRQVSDGTLGRVCAAIRKLDFACREDGTFPPEAPPLLPTRKQGGPGGFHSTPRPIPYTPEQAQAIILKATEFESRDRQIAHPDVEGGVTCHRSNLPAHPGRRPGEWNDRPECDREREPHEGWPAEIGQVFL